MCPGYRVGPIRPGQIDLAYVLVNRIAPLVALDAWRSYCRDSIGRAADPGIGPAITLATNIPGYVHGLAVWTPLDHIAHGRLLDVSLFAVISAADEAGVARDLMTHLAACAEAKGCRGLRIWLSGEAPWSGSILDGLRVEAGRGILVVPDRGGAASPTSP